MEGIEIGSVSVKMVQINDEGSVIPIVMRHEGNPKEKTKALFNQYPELDDGKVVVTGQAAKKIFDLPYRSETECLEKSLNHFGIKADILLSLGGENFLVYTLKEGRINNIFSSSKCAAGTGEFVVQQLQRMNMTLEQGIAASYKGKPVNLASRCSVYCKSDATHKLNKGECTIPDIARSLMVDLADKVMKMIELTKWPSSTIAVIGGISRNKSFIRELKSKLNEMRLVVPENSECFEAFGACLLSSELNAASGRVITKLLNDDPPRMPPLKQAEHLLDYRVKTETNRSVEPNGRYILGIDAGSTTTKAVLFNMKDGNLSASCYLRTLGNPVLATKQCIESLLNTVGDTPLSIVQAAVTGSGRELTSVFLDNCLSFNEILAHARAASDEVSELDTVFEIGGQDSKFISFVNQIPVDYAMNESCSAGTGSFLEESVSVDMGIDVEDISAIAEDSCHPIAFGERCAAFINTDLRNALQQSVKKEDVIAGLVYSIAKNYISRIVGSRSIGQKLIFQGGVALNRSVALALAQLTKKKVVVPPYPELMGCVGVCLMTMDRMKNGEVEEKTYLLEDIIQEEIQDKGSFNCSACNNRCEIRKIAVKNSIQPFGGQCSKYEQKRHSKTTLEEGKNLIKFRQNMMFDEFCPKDLKNPKGTIGLPLSLSTYEYFPFYARLIYEFGFTMVLSESSEIGRDKTKGSICYPCEIAHGTAYDLLSRGVDFILLPNLIEGDIPEGFKHSYICSSTAVIPNLIREAFEDSDQKILSPQISFSSKGISTTLKEILRIGKQLGIKKNQALNAAQKAMKHYRSFQQHYLSEGKKELEKIAHQPIIIVAGKPYVTCSSEANIALPQKIISRGFHVVPADLLPHINENIKTRNVWLYSQKLTNAINYVKKYPNMYICLVSCFSCIPDASIYHLVRENLADQTFCYLEIDSHTAHAGFETRVGAFLDIISDKRNSVN